VFVLALVFLGFSSKNLSFIQNASGSGRKSKRAYFNVSGKVVAFQIESIDDGEEISVSNSYNSDRSHTHLIQCRIGTMSSAELQKLV
jgi:hypothetical protein